MYSNSKLTIPTQRTASKAEPFFLNTNQDIQRIHNLIYFYTGKFLSASKHTVSEFVYKYYMLHSKKGPLIKDEFTFLNSISNIYFWNITT